MKNDTLLARIVHLLRRWQQSERFRLFKTSMPAIVLLVLLLTLLVWQQPRETRAGFHSLPQPGEIPATPLDIAPAQQATATSTEPPPTQTATTNPTPTDENQQTPSAADALSTVQAQVTQQVQTAEAEQMRADQFARQLQTAEVGREQAQQQALRAHSRQLVAQSANLAGEQIERSLLLAVQADTITSTIASRNQLLAALQENQRILRIPAHNDTVTSLTWRADGMMLVSGSADGTVQLWQIDSETVPLTITRGITLPEDMRTASIFAWRADDDMLASAGGDGTIKLWQVPGDTDGITEVATLEEHQGTVTSMAWQPQGDMLASASHEGTVKLWQAVDGTDTMTEVATLSVLMKSFSTLALEWRPDGRMLAARTADGTLFVWEVRDDPQPTLHASIPEHSLGLDSITWRQDGRMLAPAIANDTVKLWQMEDATPPAVVATFPVPMEIVYRSLVAAESNMLIVAGYGEHDGMGCTQAEILLWDMTDETQPASSKTLRWCSPGTNSLALQPGGHLLATGDCYEHNGISCMQGGIALWNLKNGTSADLALATLHDPDDDEATTAWWHDVSMWTPTPAADGTAMGLYAPPPPEKGIAWQADGTILTSPAADDTLQVWEIASPNELAARAILPLEPDAVQRIAWWAEQGWLAAGLDDGRVAVWEIAAGAQPSEVAVLDGHTKTVNGVDWSPVGSKLASASADGTVQIWQVEDGNFIRVATLPQQDNRLSHVAWRADGRMLAVASCYTENQFHPDYCSWGDVKLWDVDRAEPIMIARLPGDRIKGSIESIAWRADGSMLATVQQYGNVKLWQVTDETASEFADLGGLIDVRSIAWRADGQQLAMTGSQDYDREQGGMVLWDIDGSRVSQVATLPGQPGHSMHAVWLEEMPMLASVTMRGAVKVWSTDVAQWKQRACLAANRNMTMDEWQDAMGDAPYAKTCPAFPVHATVVYAQMQAAEQLAQAGDILTATQQFSEALTLDPTLAFTPSIRAKQTYAAALLKEGLQLAQAGDILTATQKYSAALAFDPTLVFMPSIRAKQIYAAALVKEGAQLAQAGDVLTATQKYSAALTFDPTLTLHPRVQAERVYAEALVKAGEELARAGDVLTATQKYSAALTFDPTLTISPSVQAGQQYADILIRAGANLASVGNILTATQKYSAALMFHPTLSLTPTVVVATIYANSLVDNAIMQASLGNIITATHMFSEALVIHPTADIQANRRRALCHYGVVNGQAAAVLSTCNQAVAGATDGEERAAMRLYRGIGYALTGNTSGAIEDLEATLTWTEDVEEYVQLTIAIPAWIEALQQGENPFTEEVLHKFR